MNVDGETKTGTRGSGFIRFPFSFPGAIVAILVAKAFWTCRERIADPDLGWHLRDGQFILVHGRFPSVDSYSFTAAGSRWLDHSWIPEVLFYSAFRSIGLKGIFIVFALASTALLLSIFLLSLKRAGDPLAAAVVTIWGGLLAMVGFTPRPQNFAWLCFVAIFAILLRFRESRQAPLWAIPLLFCLWINCHGSWSLGLAIFGIFIAAGLLKKDVGSLACDPWSCSERNRLVLLFFVSVSALFVNPFGWRLVVYPFDLAFRQKLNVGLVSEWASVDFNDVRGIYVMITLAVVFVFALAPRKPWRIVDALLIAFALFCGLKHIRFLVLTGIVLPPLIAPQIGRLSSYEPKNERYILNALVIAVVFALLIFEFPTNSKLEAEIDQFFPAKAVSYLRTHPLDGNLFNQYEWGGYLEWQLPDNKVFIDSRADIFEHKGIMGDYLNMLEGVGVQELLDRYQIRSVLLATDSTMAYFLSKDTQWQCVYADSQAVIYRRKTIEEQF